MHVFSFFGGEWGVDGRVLCQVIPVLESGALCFFPKTFNWSNINVSPATVVGENTTASLIINVWKEKKITP